MEPGWIVAGISLVVWISTIAMGWGRNDKRFDGLESVLRERGAKLEDLEETLREHILHDDMHWTRRERQEYTRQQAIVNRELQKLLLMTAALRLPRIQLEIPPSDDDHDNHGG